MYHNATCTSQKVWTELAHPWKSPQNPSWKGLPARFPPFLQHLFCYLNLADTIQRYKNRNLKPKNRIGRLKNRNLKRTDTIGRYKNRNLRPRNRIGWWKNRNSKRTDTIGRYKNRNLASADCIVRHNRKIDQSDLSPTSAAGTCFCTWSGLRVAWLSCLWAECFLSVLMVLKFVLPSGYKI